MEDLKNSTTVEPLNNNCEEILFKINEINNRFIKISKNECINNSCKRRKEEIIGDIFNLYKDFTTCNY